MHMSPNQDGIPLVHEWVSDPKLLDRLPNGSIVLCPEDEHKNHVGYQKTGDILTDELKEEFHVWASIAYTNELTSQSIIEMSHEKKVLVLHVHP